MNGKIVQILFFLFISTNILTSDLFALDKEDCLGCHGSKDILHLSPEERLEMVVPTPGKKAVRKGGISLYVEASRFETSVHGELDCLDCHTEISEIPHPQRMGAVDCSSCHQEIVDQYRESKHARVSKRLCYECHNPHYTQSFRELSLKKRIAICLKCHKDVKHNWLPQQEYHFKYLECTVCHAPKAKKALEFFISVDRGGVGNRVLTYKELSQILKTSKIEENIDTNRDRIIQIEEVKTLFSKIEKSKIGKPRLKEQILILTPYHNFTDEVEHIKDCTMCHTSKAPFYQEIFLKIPEKEKWTTVRVDKSIIAKIPPIPTKDYYWDTVHGRNGIECIECHADLKVLRTGEGFSVKTLGPPVCEKCHEEIMAEYKNSLHYRVSKKICFGCHDPHSSIPFSQLSAEERQKICTKCHKNIERKHDWLPQRRIHFKFLECTMCHSPKAKKGIVFYLRAIDKKGKEWRLTYEDIIDFLVGKDKNKLSNQDLISFIDKNDDGFLEDREIIFFIKLLNSFRDKKEERNWEKIDLGVNVLVLKPSHNYTDKGTKAKQCSICHSPRAEFYSKLVLEVPEPGGTISTIDVDKSILVAIHPIPITSDFYLLGEKRVSKRDIEEFIYVIRKIGYKWLDIFGIFLIFSVILFFGLHTIIRIVTIKIRKRRKEEK
ncbi:hypothetical protein G4V39_10520 [Thermosulfuriphilus ammonigenes]|uniref:Uncharacterized protein n=1 Tax=Thermosulfuriphilus ammonigenes TaxID=1936021 RepID=A0A6G7PYT3_9BACT|nr:cytochrome c3 family protein [Thermosulfuriphilus ammonigenes]MBA2848991.1 putative CXXCH cytochrome family protein [Thermosulfuriphilus ammonigenes]QIJ72681.1 hypothetical protein G4V39_10520 [Thermosulfuriphilus ammonigenes]